MQCIQTWLCHLPSQHPLSLFRPLFKEGHPHSLFLFFCLSLPPPPYPVNYQVLMFPRISRVGSLLSLPQSSLLTRVCRDKLLSGIPVSSHASFPPPPTFHSGVRVLLLKHQHSFYLCSRFKLFCLPQSPDSLRRYTRLTLASLSHYPALCSLRTLWHWIYCSSWTIFFFLQATTRAFLFAWEHLFLPLLAE